MYPTTRPLQPASQFLLVTHCSPATNSFKIRQQRFELSH